MKEPVNARCLAVTILDRVFQTQSYADILLDTWFKKTSLSPEDKALTTELVYGTLRWLGKLDWILQKIYSENWYNIPKIIQRDLEIGLYQILFLDKIPDYAAVNEAVKIAIEEKGMVWGRVVNFILREVLRNPGFLSPLPTEKDPVLSISVNWSHPKWLVKRWIELWGVNRTLSLCQANNERPKMSIRINRLKTDREKLKDDLRRMGIKAESSDLLDEFLYIESRGKLACLESFKRGLFTIQDVSAGLVARLMDPQPGEKIIDLTAAPGGKTTHIAELGSDKSIVVAVDRHPTRIQKVSENKNRLGLKNIFPVLADGRKMGSISVDKVLLDVPCSGLGVIRRRGEIRWQKEPEEIPKIISLQKELLKAGADLIKSGGVLVYSTCTILPEENEDVIDNFLEQHQNFTVEEASQFVDFNVVSDKGFIETWPDRHGTDGSFAVRLRKVE